MDGGAQHILASAGVLISHPAAMHQDSTEVIHEQKQVRPLAAGDVWKRHERTDAHVAHPALVGTFSFEWAEGARLTGQGGPMQTPPVQVLADRALGQTDAMPRFQDGADLDGGASWQFLAQLAGFLQQLGVAADHAEIGAWWWTESVEAMLAKGTHPAIESHARVGPATAVWMFVGRTGQLADQVAPFSRGEPRVSGFADDANAEQGDVFAWISAHEHLVQGDGAIQPAPNATVAGGLCRSPTPGRR